MKHRIALCLSILGVSLVMGLATASYAANGNADDGTSILTNGSTMPQCKTWGCIKAWYNTKPLKELEPGDKNAG